MHSLTQTIRAAFHAICASFEKFHQIQFAAPWRTQRCGE
jgi:hypothetical protein